jgi:hypothetical protein
MTRLRLNLLAVLIMAVATTAFAAPSVDRLLTQKISAAPTALTPVIITFDHKVTNNDFLVLKSLGISGGRYLTQLPMVLTSINASQFNALKGRADVKSLYAKAER